MKISRNILFIFFSLIAVCSNSQTVEYILSDFLENPTNNKLRIAGNPELITAPYGNAVYFDGVDDAFFLNQNPLNNLKEFTVEMIFKPATQSNFEQRILNIGEVSGDRMLLEIRAVDNYWYFDGYAASNGNKLALIDEERLHELNQWYHVAFVVTPNALATYVNGTLELEAPFPFKPIGSGSTSIGTRLNKRSYFKGTIYKIKITPNKINPDLFNFK